MALACGAAARHSSSARLHTEKNRGKHLLSSISKSEKNACSGTICAYLLRSESSKKQGVLPKIRMNSDWLRVECGGWGAEAPPLAARLDHDMVTTGTHWRGPGTTGNTKRLQIVFAVTSIALILERLGTQFLGRPVQSQIENPGTLNPASFRSSLSVFNMISSSNSATSLRLEKKEWVRPKVWVQSQRTFRA